MDDALASLDFFFRGIGVGAMLILAFTGWRSAATRDAKIATLLGGVSLAAWMMTEADRLWAAFGNSPLVMIPAYPIGGAFWLFIAVMFADKRVTLATLSPALALFVTGFVMTYSPKAIGEPLWVLRNAAGALLSAHAAYLIALSWRGDLVEGRRRLFAHRYWASAPCSASSRSGSPSAIGSRPTGSGCCSMWASLTAACSSAFWRC